ncbi:MAG: cytochrome c biogenesis protein CcsA [Acidobacteriota bacterium]
MRKLISTLASLKLTVVLVLLIGVVLAAGTILESLKGTEAGRAVYYSPPFFLLQGVFALNLIAALIERWPRNRWRIGFAITHTSILVILLGALTTWVYKVEGQLALWEGESAAKIVERGAHDQVLERTLPFTVRLDAFELDTYPGTRMPAMFRSRVTVIDPVRGTQQPAVIQMNQPLHYGGYSFFQSSYQMQQGRKASVLSVSRDPGQPIVFIGYFLLVGGMIVVFATRLVQARQLEQLRAASASEASASPNRSAPVVALGRGARTAGLLLILGLALAAAPLRAAQVPDAATVAQVRALPVQYDGRAMPFDTEARESVWKVTGKRAWPGVDPVAMALGWAFDPPGWRAAPIVKLPGSDLRALLGIAPGTRYASFDSLVANPKLLAAARAAHALQNEDAKLAPLDKDVLKLEERLIVLDEFFGGQAIRPLPAADPSGPWQVPGGLRSAADLAALGARLRSAPMPPHYPSPRLIDKELAYNAYRPSRIAWIALLVAALAAAFTVGADRFGLRWVAAAGLLVGFGAMTWGLAMRWQIAGHIPAANMYESMLFLGWGVGLFGVVALVLRQRLLLANATGLGAIAMMLADLLPVDPFLHPIPPVLSGTPWLAIHVPIIVVSYSVLAMATGIGHLVIGVEIFAPRRRALSQRASETMYWYLHVGSILLIAGILTGSIWAASSWGRYWGWDPKEVWSLVAFLAYMAILHARHDGQIRGFGVALSSIAAFWTILMTYLGVNFVLASGLHSYGFGSSNLVRIMGMIALAEILFLSLGWAAHRRRLAAGGEPAAAA